MAIVAGRRESHPVAGRRERGEARQKVSAARSTSICQHNFQPEEQLQGLLGHEHLPAHLLVGQHGHAMPPPVMVSAAMPPGARDSTAVRMVTSRCPGGSA